MFATANWARTIQLAIFLSAFFPGSPALAEDNWKLELPVYVWLPTINVETPTGQKSKITPDDILDNLDMAAMLTPSLYNDRWSVTTDIIYFDLSKKDRTPLQPGLDLRQIELQSSIITPSVGYRVYGEGDNRAEIYLGARFIWLKPTLKLQTVDPNPSSTFHQSQSDDQWNGVLGVRGAVALGSNWYARYTADAGTGDSDYVYNLLLGFGYRFKSVDAVLAWRYMEYDFGDDWVMKSMDINGPLAGVAFRF